MNVRLRYGETNHYNSWRKMMQKQGTLAEWIVKKCMTKAYIIGKNTKTKHFKVEDELRELFEKRELETQAYELERNGLITCKRWSVNQIVGLDVPLRNIPKICDRIKMEDKHQTWLQCCKIVEDRLKATQAPWLLQYYEKKKEQLENGSGMNDIMDSEFLSCLDAIGKLKEDVWKRKFSSDILHDSKKFEKKYQTRVTNILKEYCGYAEIEEMIEDDISEENQKGRSKSIAQDLILSEFHIMTYSQNLTLKGALEYEVRRGEKTKIVSSKDQYYGTVINAQTLMNSEPTSLQGIKKIVTVENQANYEDMPYEEGCVYIFVHGFPSFKERNFILQMLKLAEDGIEVFHWGDMDFGGIRIYQYLKKNLFPQLKPMNMGRKDFEKAIEEGHGIKLNNGKREKLEKMDAGDLEELKQCILEYGLVVEQESI